MADIYAERSAVIEWFKTRFSQEAATSARTSRLPDGSLGFVFSVVNSSGVDFDNFSFKVKVADRDSGREIGSANINAGQWRRGDKKNFKSALKVPANVTNITFIMEPLSYEAKETDTLGEAARDMMDAARDMGQALGKAGEGMGSMLGELFGTGGMPDSEQAGGAMVQQAPRAQQAQQVQQSARPAPTPHVQRQQAQSTQSRPVTNPVQSVGQAAQSFSRKKLEKKLNKKRMGKSGWIVAGIVIGVIFLMASAGSVMGSPDQIIDAGIGVAALIASLVGKLMLNKKAKRIRTYETKVNKQGNTSIDDLCSYVGRPFEKVADELHQMIVDGFFPDSYVDIDNRMLVMTKDGKPIEDVARSAAFNKKAKRKAARDGGAVPESLDDLITMTDDAEIKGKLQALRTVTKKIDERVEQVPELEKQVTDYREKYYPEVVRLTDEYNEKIVDMGKYGEDNIKAEVSEASDGSPVLNTNPNYLQEQAAEIKSQLISLIDSVTEASENLLERLHEGDIMDITTDIKMLQTTLASKGLLDSDFDVK